jgi:hypothetical protein
MENLTAANFADSFLTPDIQISDRSHCDSITPLFLCIAGDGTRLLLLPDQ